MSFDKTQDTLADLRLQVELEFGDADLESIRQRLDEFAATRAIQFMHPGLGREIAHDKTLDGRAALAAINCVRRSVSPDDTQIAALRTFLQLLRPVLLVRDGQVCSAGHVRWKEPARAIIEAVVPWVAAICWNQAGAETTPCGTGLLLRDRQLVTCKHVWDHFKGRSAVATFELHDATLRTPHWIEIIEEVHRHPSQDLVVLRLNETPPALRDKLPPLLQRATPRGRSIAAVGHPMPDGNRNPFCEEVVFAGGGKQGDKRVSLGHILRKMDGQILHDCNTLGSSSGSPLVDCETGGLVGINSDGIFGAYNMAVLAVCLTEIAGGY